MTPQKEMKSLLEKAGLPFKSIEVFGGHIIVTSLCEATARKWAILIAKFASKIRVARGLDQTQASLGIKPEYVEVWRTGATI